jgi:hypothetical protein
MLTPAGLIVTALALIALSRVGFGRCLDLDRHLPWSVVALQSLAKVVLLDPLSLASIALSRVGFGRCLDLKKALALVGGCFAVFGQGCVAGSLC